MSLIRCWQCNRDPAGRWVQPAALILIDDRHPDGSPRLDGEEFYTCREHASGRLEEALRAREAARGFPIK